MVWLTCRKRRVLNCPRLENMSTERHCNEWGQITSSCRTAGQAKSFITKDFCSLRWNWLRVVWRFYCNCSRILYVPTTISVATSKLGTSLTGAPFFTLDRFFQAENFSTGRTFSAENSGPARCRWRRFRFRWVFFRKRIYQNECPQFLTIILTRQLIKYI